MMRTEMPGVMVATVEAPYTLTDGPFAVTVEWEDADGEHAPGYWVARLVDADEAKRVLRFAPMADGPTKEAALANLSMAIYNALMDDRP